MRVSSADDRQTVDLQRDALVAAGVDHRHFHTDKASDARDDRPGLKACLDYLNAGDTLIVWTLNRLGRPLPHLLSIVTDLKARGITFRSLTEQMNTTTSHGELLLSLFGARAQYDRALMRERVMVGLAAAKRRERQGGRPPMINTEIPERIAAGTGRWAARRLSAGPQDTALDAYQCAGPDRLDHTGQDLDPIASDRLSAEHDAIKKRFCMVTHPGSPAVITAPNDGQNILRLTQYVPRWTTKHHFHEISSGDYLAG